MAGSTGRCNAISFRRPPPSDGSTHPTTSPTPASASSVRATWRARPSWSTAGWGSPSDRRRPLQAEAAQVLEGGAAVHRGPPEHCPASCPTLGIWRGASDRFEEDVQRAQGTVAVSGLRPSGPDRTSFLALPSSIAATRRGPWSPRATPERPTGRARTQSRRRRRAPRHAAPSASSGRCAVPTCRVSLSTATPPHAGPCRHLPDRTAPWRRQPAVAAEHDASGRFQTHQGLRRSPDLPAMTAAPCLHRQGAGPCPAAACRHQTFKAADARVDDCNRSGGTDDSA